MPFRRVENSRDFEGPIHPGLYLRTVTKSMWNSWLCLGMSVNLPLSQAQVCFPFPRSPLALEKERQMCFGLWRLQTQYGPFLCRTVGHYNTFGWAQLFVAPTAGHLILLTNLGPKETAIPRPVPSEFPGKCECVNLGWNSLISECNIRFCPDWF